MRDGIRAARDAGTSRRGRSSWTTTTGTRHPRAPRGDQGHDHQVDAGEQRVDAVPPDQSRCGLRRLGMEGSSRRWAQWLGTHKGARRPPALRLEGGNYLYSYLPLSTPSDRVLSQTWKVSFHAVPCIVWECLGRTSDWRGRGIPQFLRHMKPIPLAEGTQCRRGTSGPRTRPPRFRSPYATIDTTSCMIPEGAMGCNAIIRDGARDEWVTKGHDHPAPTAPSSFDLDAALPRGRPSSTSTGAIHGARVRGRENGPTESHISPEWHPPSELPIWFHDCPLMPNPERLRRRFPSCHDCWHATRPHPILRRDLGHASWRILV